MPQKKKPVTLKELYPDLGPEDLERLYEWYERYAALILRIFERLEREGNLDKWLEEHQPRTPPRR